MSVPDWSRAYGAPLFSARLRSAPEDFQVTEELGWQPAGDGEHDYLWLEKTGANTEWVAQQLANHAQVPVKDVGFSGLKDRHAVTRQWFSVPRWHGPQWDTLAVEGVRVVEVTRHLRKLRRGAHDHNHFVITLRIDQPLDTAELSERLAVIEHRGVPNYFGEQRFGRQGNNLQLASDWARGKRLSRNKRSLAISVIRSYVFNEALAQRVASDSWDRLQPGDKANLNGSGSVFEIDQIDDALLERCQTMDIHPAIPLIGEGSNSHHTVWQAALDRARVKPDSRSLRLPVPALASEVAADHIQLSFRLGRGTFATSVLRELCSW